MEPTVFPQLNAESLLTRKAAAAALTEIGFPVRAKTLATKASRGGGPPFHRFGSRVLYRWAELLAWAQNRLSPPVAATAEFDQSRQSVADEQIALRSDEDGHRDA